MATIGLHLTKCAGTSLVSLMRRKLTEDEYVLMSSFWENLIANRPNFEDLHDFSNLRFVFGHYLHENIIFFLSQKNPWSFFLFTGIRNPKDRLVSYYNHFYRVSGRELSLKEFVEQNGDNLCAEIIRPFPSLVDHGVSKFENAAKILTMFNYIYSTENYHETILPVFESLNVEVSSGELSEVDNKGVSYLTDDQIEEIAIASSDTDDFKLFNSLKSLIGTRNFGVSYAESLGIPCIRERWWNDVKLKNDSVLRQEVIDFQLDFMGYELHLLGEERKKIVLDRLKSRLVLTANQIGYLNFRKY